MGGLAVSMAVLRSSDDRQQVQRMSRDQGHVTSPGLSACSVLALDG